MRNNMETEDPIASSAQAELVQRFCREAIDAMADARDKASAETIADAMCERFAARCSSELVVNAVRHYIQHWLRTRWV